MARVNGNIRRYHCLQALNGFHKNLNFTIGTFDDKKVHFLDLLIDRNTTDIFYKDPHTGQYTNYNSFVPWNFKTSRVKSLYPRAPKSATQDAY